jgi:hypothetical protein
MIRKSNSILDRMTSEDLAIMRYKFDRSDPNRICTEEELHISREQIRIQQKYRMTEGEYFTAIGRKMGQR